MLFYIEHAIRDAISDDEGGRRVVSNRMFYVEIDQDRNPRRLEYAPYLDYRPLRTDNETDSDPTVTTIIESEQCAWIYDFNMEKEAKDYIIEKIASEHLKEIRDARQIQIEKIRDAVKDRLANEINHCDQEANECDRRADIWSSQPNEPKSKEYASTAKRLASNSRRKSSDLHKRMEDRLYDLSLQEQMIASPPIVSGGALVIPQGLLDDLRGFESVPDRSSPDTQASAAKAREITMEVERKLGFEPVDCENEKLGYDIESRMPDGRLRLIEVKGRISGAPTIKVTLNEILTSLNKPENYILSIVEFFDNGDHKVHYVRKPFQKDVNFEMTSVDYATKKLLKRSKSPS